MKFYYTVTCRFLGVKSISIDSSTTSNGRIHWINLNCRGYNMIKLKLPCQSSFCTCESPMMTYNLEQGTVLSYTCNSNLTISEWLVRLRHAQTISISMMLQWSSQHREIWWSSPPSTTSTCMPTPLVPSIPCLHWSNALTSAFTWFRDFTLHDLSVFETSYNLRAWKLKFPLCSWMRNP